MEAAKWQWEKERLRAQEELRKFEREQSLERIAMLMPNHEISLDELALHIRSEPSAC